MLLIHYELMSNITIKFNFYYNLHTILKNGQVLVSLKDYNWKDHLDHSLFRNMGSLIEKKGL